MVYNDILELVGNTPLVRLNQIAKGLKPCIVGKLEFISPGGSIKDRIGLGMVADAEARGELKPGGTIIEGTSGNTGAGLAMVAAVRGYRSIFTMPDKMSQEKIDTLRALGAEVVVTPTAVPHDDPRSYHSVAVRLHQKTPNSIFPNQYDNPSNPKAHYHTTAPEIWEQTQGQVTHIVVSVGTGGTISGIGRWFKEHHPHVQILGVDPEGSIFYDFFHTGQQPPTKPYKIEGVGQDELPQNVDFNVIDDMLRIGDKEAFNITRQLARMEGIFAGGSTGMALAAALKIAAPLIESDLVVVIFPDSGSKYLSKIFNDNWMKENQFLDSPTRLTTGDVLMQKIGSAAKVISISSDANIGEAVELMQAHGISQIPVITEGQVLGSLDESRLLSALLRDAEGWQHSVSEFMDAPFPVVPEDTPLENLASILQDNIPALLIECAAGELAVVTKSDLLSTLLKAEKALSA